LLWLQRIIFAYFFLKNTFFYQAVKKYEKIFIDYQQVMNGRLFFFVKKFGRIKKGYTFAAAL